jgi:4-diphosphocytidyl-2-C-methyl-D-erythritol kinase
VANPRTQYWTGQDVPPLVNTLEAAAVRLEPAIALAGERLRDAGVAQVLVSGSGPTVFGLVASEAEASRIASDTGGVAARFVPRTVALALE